MRGMETMRLRMPSSGPTARHRRAGRTGAELLLLMAFVMAVSLALLSSASQAGAPGAAPLAATVTVAAPSRDLPVEVSDLEIEVRQLTPLPFRELAGLVAALAGVEASIRERPGRVLDGDVALNDPVPFGLSMTGPVAEVLDEVARLSGYDWGWEDGRLVFRRYADREQRAAQQLPAGVAVGVLAAVAENEAEAARSAGADAAPVGTGAADAPPAAPAAAAALEGQDGAAPEEAAPAPPPAWEVAPDEHGTVEEVLRAWAARAGWQVAWRSARRYAVGAAASFPAGETEEEGFLAAADALLAIRPMRRTLTATAYPNRWLVVRDIGSAAP